MINMDNSRNILIIGMLEADRQQLVDDHFLFVSGDKNLIAAGMERDWPEGNFHDFKNRSSYLNNAKFNSDASHSNTLWLAVVDS